MELVYMGNWVANAQRTERLEEYEEIESLIFSHAKDFGFEEYMDDEQADEGKFYPTSTFERGTKVMEFIHKYDAESFWDELVDHMTLQEFERKFSQAEIEAMSDEKRRKEFYALEEQCGKEFEENGLENFRFLNI